MKGTDCNLFFPLGRAGGQHHAERGKGGRRRGTWPGPLKPGVRVEVESSKNESHPGSCRHSPSSHHYTRHFGGTGSVQLKVTHLL